jgi:drug/metabolite transporter (DMT)-like permease
MKPVWLVVLLLMNVLWAAAYSLFQPLKEVLDPGTLTTLRFGLAALVVLGIWPLLPGAAPRGRELLRAVVMGVVVFGVAPRLQVAGVQGGSAGDTAILMAFDPVIVSIAAALFLREHIAARTWLGCGLGLAGVAILTEFWTPAFKWSGLIAYALVLASFVCESTYSIVGKPLLARSDPVKVLASAIAAGSAVNLAVDAGAVGRALPTLQPEHWLALAYLVVICTVVGYILWFYAVREMPVNLVAVTVFMQPPAGVLFDLLLNGNAPRWSQLGGTACIALGLLISLRRRTRAALVRPAGMRGDAEAST